MTEYIITGEQLERLEIPDMFTECEIVRCRDCECYEYAEVHRFDGSRRREPTCARLTGCAVETQPDGFCKWGERK